MHIEKIRKEIMILKSSMFDITALAVMQASHVGWLEYLMFSKIPGLYRASQTGATMSATSSLTSLTVVTYDIFWGSPERVS